MQYINAYVLKIDGEQLTALKYFSRQAKTLRV